jgi:hypothetical protein
MRGISAAFGAFTMIIASGCGKAPPPAYAAPTDHEARLAYADALRASLKEPGNAEEGPPEGVEEDYVEAMARGARIHRAKAAIANNKNILSSLETLAKAELSGCVWTALDLDDATGDADVDPAAYPGHAYRCTVKIIHDTHRRGRVEATTDGYFFRNGNSFVYVGKAAHGFKRTKDVERGLA